MKEEGRGFYCIQFEGVALSQGLSSKIKVQNPTSAKIATLENSPLYGIIPQLGSPCIWNSTESRRLSTVTVAIKDRTVQFKLNHVSLNRALLYAMILYY